MVARRARPAPAASLQGYRAKRDFGRTPEPAPEDSAAAHTGGAGLYVIQKHHATRLHYDFRLELDGVLLSWAVPKGPSLDPADKRMAVRTEDHPLAYAEFEGRIPAGEYGAGDVIVWDRGRWQPVGDAHDALAAGKLAFDLDGEKLQGRWELVRIKPRVDATPSQRKETWLLFKRSDAHARPHDDYDVTRALPDSVLGRVRRERPVAPAQAKAPKAGTARSPARAAAGALPAVMPASLAPQLAQLADAVPAGTWLFERKLDGYRLLVRIEAGTLRLITRNGHDWTARMPALAQALGDLDLGSAWVDGELIVPGAHGGGDFNALQNAFDRVRPRRTAVAPTFEYRAFDLPYFEGHDLRAAPLWARRQLLEKLLQGRARGPVCLSDVLGQGGPELAARLLQQVCAAGQEGLMAKHPDAPYSGTRSSHWLKLKCHRRQEFVIGGFLPRSDDDTAVGSLVLGVHDAQGRLQHAGSVGTGWDRRGARALHAKLLPLRWPDSPFQSGQQAPARGRRRADTQWVQPQLLAEVRFAAWTPAGHVRHASFVALRDDKPAHAITRDEPRGDRLAPAQAPASRGAAAPRVHGQVITHPARVIDATSGRSKIDLVRYYDSVAGQLLPQLAGRPVALLRAPAGIDGAQFFQKHAAKGRIAGVRELDPALWPGHEPLLEVQTPEGLVGAAQMNVIEFHTWNATTRHLDKPDRMVFDLDPGDGVAWPAIREGALLVRALLQALGLQCWLKTSGGKGLHVVVPLAPRWSFEVVKAFSKAVVEHLAQTIPARFVAKSGPANRRGRIFVDYLRNGEGATTVAAWSARARPGLPVSMPMHWDDLPALKGPAVWTIVNARDHLSLREADPWAGLAGCRQSLSGPMKALRFERPPPGAARPA